MPGTRSTGHDRWTLSASCRGTPAGRVPKHDGGSILWRAGMNRRSSPLETLVIRPPILANAPPPVLFAGRRVRPSPFFLPPERGAERREAPVRNAAPRGPPCGRAGPSSGKDHRPMTRAGAPLGAPPRRFLSLVPRFPARDGRLSPSRSEGLPPPFVPATFSHRRQPVIVPAGGWPGPPGAGGASRSSGRRSPLHPQDASGRRPSMSGDAQEYNQKMWPVKEYFQTSRLRVLT
jgi:hypothetical protein